jgi:hypothetical protein
VNPWVTEHSSEILECARRHGLSNGRVFGSMPIFPAEIVLTPCQHWA